MIGWMGYSDFYFKVVFRIRLEFSIGFYKLLTRAVNLDTSNPYEDTQRFISVNIFSEGLNHVRNSD